MKLFISVLFLSPIHLLEDFLIPLVCGVIGEGPPVPNFVFGVNTFLKLSKKNNLQSSQ